jgi:nucleotide-binding universal stress UspA family protein
LTLGGISVFREEASRVSPSLLVMPRQGVPRPRGDIRRIGCAIDGGEAAAFALRVAAKAALGLEAELEVMRGLTTASPVIERVVSEELAAGALAQLRAAMASLPNGLSAQGIIIQDRDPAQGIASRSRALDILVVGTRTGSPAGSALLGEFSARLAEQAECPLLVVPLGVETPLAELFRA